MSWRDREAVMNQIQPYSLWLGHAGEGRDLRQMLDQGIQALVHLAIEEPPATPPRELTYCRFPILDGAGNHPELLFLAASTIASLVRLRVPTLVTCGAGLSRSPALTAAALAMVVQQPPDDCLKRVVEHHASDVSPGLWSQITGMVPAAR